MALGEPFEQRTLNVAHIGKFAGAAMIDPVPELRGAHARFALVNAEFGNGGKDFGARGAGEVLRRARARLGDGGHGRLLARAGKGGKGGLEPTAQGGTLSGVRCRNSV